MDGYLLASCISLHRFHFMLYLYEVLWKALYDGDTYYQFAIFGKNRSLLFIYICPQIIRL